MLLHKDVVKDNWIWKLNDYGIYGTVSIGNIRVD